MAADAGRAARWSGIGRRRAWRACSTPGWRRTNAASRSSHATHSAVAVAGGGAALGRLGPRWRP